MAAIADAINYCAGQFQTNNADFSVFQALINRSHFRIADCTLYIWCQGEQGESAVEAQLKGYLNNWMKNEQQHLWEAKVTHQQPRDPNSFQPIAPHVPQLFQGEQAPQQHYRRPGFG